MLIYFIISSQTLRLAVVFLYRTSGGALPLRKVNFSVFALGSSAYPIFCAFGKKLDELMLELGARQMHPVGTGDELLGQEQSFIRWTTGAFKVS